MIASKSWKVAQGAAKLFLVFSVLGWLLTGGCAVAQTKLNAISRSSNEAMLEHRRAVADGAISLEAVLKDIEGSAIYKIKPQNRRLEIAGAINLVKAPGVSDGDLIAESVTELGVVFQVAPAPFETVIRTFRVFFEDDRVIAIGFFSDSISGFKERTEAYP